jgi:hypothetical protein
MHLREALGVTSADEVDTARPLKMGPLELGIEAAAEAARILAGGEFPRDVHVEPREFARPIYWFVAHKAAGEAEVFGFPAGADCVLPTAIEIALVRTIAAAAPELHNSILAGGAEISLGPAPACIEFRRIIGVVVRPMAGKSLLFNGATQAIIDENVATLLNKTALSCLANSFRTSPLKFRFLELYRVMEARFLAEIKFKLISGFDAEPSVALSEALEGLKTEINQITGLAETQKDAFETCWTALDQLKNVNRFATALFRRVEKRGAANGGKWKTGAALVYQIRCAIVHAGEKDMIFENFPDGEEALEAVLPHIERAALLLVGVDILKI